MRPVTRFLVRLYVCREKQKAHRFPDKPVKYMVLLNKIDPKCLGKRVKKRVGRHE